MLAYSPARIVNDARQLTRSANVSLAEVMFVLSNTELTEVEKMLWLLLAMHAESANLTCTFSYAQLSFGVNHPHQTVHGALLRLRALGFLQSDDLLETFTPLQLLRHCHFVVQLPLAGLLALKKTPRCKEPEALHDKGIYRRPPIMINLLNNRLRGGSCKE
jgi:hypothetical protein